MSIKSNFPSIRPSLNLDFANTKRLDPRITFSRASSATYVDANGVIQTAAANVPRFDHDPATGESLGLLIEEQRANLLPYNQQLANAYWDNNAGIIAIPNNALAPDQTYTALLVRQDTSTSEHRFANSLNISSTSNGQLSIFVKSNGCRYVGLSQNTESYVTTIFDLNNGTVVSGAGRIINYGNGWYRISEFRGENCYRPNFHLLNAVGSETKSFTGDGTSGVWIWGFQRETGSFPTSLISTPATFTGRSGTATYYDANGTIQTAGDGVARSNAYFPDSSGVMRPAGLLLEAAGTNLLTYSEQFDNAAWLTYGTSTVSANVTTAPNGTNTADKLVEASSNGAHIIGIAGTTLSNPIFSCFAKAAERSYLNLRLYISSTDYVYATYSLIDGSITVQPTVVGSIFSLPTVKVDRLSNSWFRLSLSASCGSNFMSIGIDLSDTAIPSSRSSGVPIYQGDGTSGIYIWGAQLEASPYPTSYIPTVASTVTRNADTSTSATVTRSADVASITGSNFSSWYRQDEGTIIVKRSSTQSATGNYTPEWQILGADNGPQLLEGTVYGVSGPFLSITGYSFSAGSVAVAMKANDFAACFNGGTVSTNTSQATQSNRTTLRLGRQVGGNETFMTTRFARFAFYPYRLTNTQLQNLTR